MVSFSTTRRTLIATVVGDDAPLAAGELAQACGARIEWVARLVEVGIVQSAAPGEDPAGWRFRGGDLERALQARRLERDFGAGLDAAALIIDLQHEVRRLRAILRAQAIDAR